MLSEERVKHMAKMAIFEKNEQNSYSIASKFSKRDYLSRSMVIGCLTLTLIFAMIYLSVIAILLSSVIENVTTVVIILFIMVGIIAYILSLSIHLRFTESRAIKRYKASSKSLKKLISDYEILDELYRKEEADVVTHISEDIMHEL